MRFALPALALLLAGCLSSDDDNLARQAWEKAVVRWNQSGPESYSFTYTQACVCPGPQTPVLIVVRNKVVESRTVVITGEPLEPQFAGRFPAIPGMFQTIDEAIRRRPFSIEAAYDPDLGYPTWVYINDNATTAADDQTYSAAGLVPLDG